MVHNSNKRIFCHHGNKINGSNKFILQLPIMNIAFFIMLTTFLIPLPSTTYRRRRSAQNVTKKCYDELGCLVTNKVWYHPENRPENPEPANRHTVKTQFIYYTRNQTSKNFTSKAQVVPVRKDFIELVGFKCEFPTLVFIHDFTSHGGAGWIKHITEGVMSIAHFNVFSVDWEFGARPPYAQAASNARVVALEVIFLLKCLQSRLNMEVKDVHIIGHGLGAHIAGYVGGNVRGIGKITALDPSGPYFHGMPACVRLDCNDAKVVQVIHTDTMETKGETGQGISEPLGHFDFYPNFGYKQPGCEENVDYPKLLKVSSDSIPPGHTLPGCSHKRAFKYLKDALMFPECPFMGFKCRTKDAWLNGQCTTCGDNSVNCVPIHLLNNKFPKGEPAKYFLSTNVSSPFCLFPYNIALQLAVPEDVSYELEGTITVQLQEGKRIVSLNFVNSWPQKFEQGRMNNFLGYHSGPKLKNVDHCQLTWKGVSRMFRKSSPTMVVVALYVTSFGSYPPSNTSIKMCSCNNKPNVPIPSGESGVFVKCGLVPTSDIRNSMQ